MVDGSRHVGQQIRIAVATTGDQGADLDAFGLLGPGAEHGPAFEVCAVGIAGQRVEVVPVEDDVHPGVLGPQDGVAYQPVIGCVLGLELNTDAYRTSHATLLTRGMVVFSHHGRVCAVPLPPQGRRNDHAPTASCTPNSSRSRVRSAAYPGCEGLRGFTNDTVSRMLTRPSRSTAIRSANRIASSMS